VGTVNEHVKLTHFGLLFARDKHSDSNISAVHPNVPYTQSIPHCFHLIESLETISPTYK
jgi:hypothetical protein